MRGRILVSLASVTMALLIPAAAGATGAQGPRVRVSPSAIGPHTNVVVRFRQPVTTGVQQNLRASEVLWLRSRSHRPAGVRCITDEHLLLAPAPAGTLVRRTLRPALMRGLRWCLGNYRVVLLLSEFPQCDPQPRRMCPMFMIAPRALATFSFRVTRR